MEFEKDIDRLIIWGAIIEANIFFKAAELIDPKGENALTALKKSIRALNREVVEAKGKKTKNHRYSLTFLQRRMIREWDFGRKLKSKNENLYVLRVERSRFM